MPSPQSRSYCFTLNNHESNDLPELEDIRYLVYQREKGENGTEHIQGYVELSKSRTLAYVKNWLPRAHFEIRRGTREQARDYCRKDDTRIEGPFERGTWESGGTGARSDLLAVKRKIDEGKPMSEVWDEHFETTLRYYRGFQEYKKLKLVIEHGNPKYTYSGENQEQANLEHVWNWHQTPTGKQETSGGWIRRTRRCHIGRLLRMAPLGLIIANP